MKIYEINSTCSQLHWLTTDKDTLPKIKEVIPDVAITEFDNKKVEDFLSRREYCYFVSVKENLDIFEVKLQLDEHKTGEQVVRERAWTWSHDVIYTTFVMAVDIEFAKEQAIERVKQAIIDKSYFQYLEEVVLTLGYNKTRDQLFYMKNSVPDEATEILGRTIKLIVDEDAGLVYIPMFDPISHEKLTVDQMVSYLDYLCEYVGLAGE